MRAASACGGASAKRRLPPRLLADRAGRPNPAPARPRSRGKTAGRGRCSASRRRRPAAASRSGSPWPATGSAVPGARDRRPRPARAAIRARTGWRSTASTTAPTAATPHDPEPPQRAAVELVFLGQKPGQQAAGIVGIEGCRPDGRDLLPSIASSPPRPPQITAEHYQELRREPESRAFARVAGKRFMTAAGGTVAVELQGIRMTARSSLTVVLAAGEGTRMRSSLPKVLHPVAGQPLLAHVLARRTPGRRRRACGRDRARPSGGRRRGAAAAPGRRDLRSARAARHRACGAGGARRRSRAAPTICWSRSATRR